ncbi:MAG TPA: tRNA pseudouridine(38-40) synthase TruA, partial [Anaerolineae bacterium]|nr:tRNA pseudouridine(38-40) synthase TruA [Anaerolineae bacterium]
MELEELGELTGADAPQASQGEQMALSSVNSASSPSSERLAALVEYDGTVYAGFQVQVGSRTIQGELERGLAAITGQAVRITAAGRTDAGVHALGQVVHLQAAWAHSLGDLQRAWNANLPDDIAILALARVGPEFHARFSARSRVYRYQIYSAAVRRPLVARYAWHVNRPLDVRRMDEAAALLVGRHDLRSFGQAPQGDNTVRTVLATRCWAEGALVCIEIEADAFLQHMVRRVAATLVAVGRGRLSVDDFGVIIRTR